ncbi:MAG: AMP-binding protein, partial [Candidatus Binatia bacterium]
MLLLGEILRRHAAYRGKKLAYVIGEARVSYAEMNERANRLAHVLAGRGVGAGDRVAILARNMPLYPEAYFAAAKLGAILVPLNTRHREAEVEYALNQSEAKVLLFSSEHEALVDGLRRSLLSVESYLAMEGTSGGFAASLPEALPAAPASEPRAAVHENDPHVMLYT